MKTIVITGANGNLGSAVTKKFLSSDGYRIVATVSKEADRKTLKQQHPDLDVYALNLEDEDGTARFVDSLIEKYGKIDAALMLVGGFMMGDIRTTAAADISRMYSLNFETAYHLARPLFAHMHANGYGRLVFVGARPVLDAEEAKEKLAYALSKSLLFQLAEYLNAEAKDTNLVSTVIVPGIIDTPANRESMPEANTDNWVKAENVAELIEFICSHEGMAVKETVLKAYRDNMV